MKLTGLFIHPIKACRGIRVSEARVTDRGLEHDRRYMLVDERGIFFTQRTDARLAGVGTALVGDEIQISVSGFGEARVPLVLSEGAWQDVVVWRSTVRARRHEEGSSFFTQLLGRPLSLVYMPDESERGVNPEFGRATDRVSFADGYPFLIVSERSLEDLSTRVGRDMAVERFRPNLLIDGDAPFVEDRMAAFTVGGVRFLGVKPCERCVVTTIDPESGKPSNEPLRTLTTYRRGAKRGVIFGMNLVHDSTGVVRVGDEVAVERWAGES